MMVLPGFVAHWRRMGIGTVWIGTEIDQLLLDFLPVTLNKPSMIILISSYTIIFFTI
jgi:hypothetical protein